ncbi:MAG: fibronectin/fibrinogen-binding protein [Clostridiales bacterium]|nr:fibronectin/fibrinogen-binding protein [Clostridiales bacterium]
MITSNYTSGVHKTARVNFTQKGDKMAFDGLVTRAIAKELAQKIEYGKIEKIYQPDIDELVFNIHTKTGNVKLYASCNPSHARVHFTEQSFDNPAVPLSFCMLMRKHFTGGRITKVAQKNIERIIEIEVETISELGFSVNKKIIFEIMGKHSNIIAMDQESGKIIDCIKHVSFDVNRVRQLLPGKIYEYPPAQDKISFDDVTLSDLEACVFPDNDARSKAILSHVRGISPVIAGEIADNGETASELFDRISSMRDALESMELTPATYVDNDGVPKEFHVFPLTTHGLYYETKTFATACQAVENFYLNKNSSNRVKQKSNDLARTTKAALDKMYLKKQRLSNDLLKAENSEDYRLYGELLNANIYAITPGAKEVSVLNYYTGENITIPLDVKLSPSKNAQSYFKKYGKAKTAVKEKALQLEDVNRDIEYLESVSAFIDNAQTENEIEVIRDELIEGGYLRRRKNIFKAAKKKSSPLEYRTSEGYRVLVGRNNVENDFLTFKQAGSRDVWFHTKDIPGSHVILFTEGKDIDDLSEAAIFETASLAAYYSKGRASENVPVDYVQAKFVKKPNGAKPGMVIFTNNRTVWTNPALPETKEEK